MSKPSKFEDILLNLKNKLSKAEDDYDGMDFQDYGLSDEDLQGMSVVGGDEMEGDAADTWLKQQEGAQPKVPQAPTQDQSQAQGPAQAVQESQQEGIQEEGPKKKKVGSFIDWEPHGEYSDEQSAKIKELMDEGYSHREAETMAGASKFPHMNFQEALNHNVFPSEMSDRHLADMAEIAKHWITNKSNLDKLHADPEKEPIKHASGRAMKAHEEATKDYNEAFNNFINSDEFKNLKGRERFKARQQWRQKYMEENPDFHEKVTSADVHSGFRDAGSVGGGSKGAGASGKMGQTIQERLDAIAGVSGGEGMSSEAAAQHVGGIKTDTGTQASTVQDPLAGSAVHAKQREMAAKQRAQQMIQRMGNPDQQDRFKRLRSAKSVIRRPAKSKEEQ